MEHIYGYSIACSLIVSTYSYSMLWLCMLRAPISWYFLYNRCTTRGKKVSFGYSTHSEIIKMMMYLFGMAIFQLVIMVICSTTRRYTLFHFQSFFHWCFIFQCLPLNHHYVNLMKSPFDFHVAWSKITIHSVQLHLIIMKSPSIPFNFI